jgi:competence protein ComEC
MKGTKAVILSVILSVVLAGLIHFLLQQTPVSDGSLAVKVLSIGQGDAILIQSGRDTVLVDSGDVGARARLLELLAKEKVQELNLLVSTHPHADHIGGAEPLLDKIPTRKIWDSGQTHSSGLFINYLKKIREKNIEFVKVKRGDRQELDEGAYLEVLWPEEELLRGTDSDLNNNSIVLKLVKGDFSLLLTGDIQKEAELAMIKNVRERLKADVLKAPHHGSNTSSTAAFLRAVGANAVVISCGKNNDYGFPKAAVVKRYIEHGMTIYVTADDGTVAITSDGSDYTLAKENE